MLLAAEAANQETVVAVDRWAREALGGGRGLAIGMWILIDVAERLGEKHSDAGI